jgi:hypothetical protein
MLAAAIWVYARPKADVRAVVVVDDLAGVVPEEPGPHCSILGRVPLRIGFEMDFLEPIGRVMSGTAAALGKGFWGRHDASKSTRQC